MALAAMAMLVLGTTLTRTRHARLWAIGFGFEALQWALVAVFQAGLGGPSWSTGLIALLSIGGSIFYTAGFEQRVHRLRPLLLLGIAVGLVGMRLLLLLSLSRVAQMQTGYMLSSAVRAGLFVYALVLVIPQGRRASATELSIMVMLGVAAAIEMGVVAASSLTIFGGASRGSFAAALAYTITPLSAALGLFTLMLIASDFSRERFRLIETDPLTGVLNRSGFEARARQEIARSRPPARPLSLVLADIDRFKSINDTFGHLTGDAALIGFAAQIVDGLPRSAVIGRFGGEEFAVVMRGQRAGTAEQLIESVRMVLPAMAIPGGARLDLTASFGIAERRPHETLDDLYARADAALYLSKQSGRNRTSIAPAPVS